MLPADVLKKVNELLEQLHRKDKDHQGSKIEFVYVAPGAQHVETVQNQYLYPAPSPSPHRGGEVTVGGKPAYDRSGESTAVTMPSIDERAAYAHYHEHRPHIASFCGTGNNTQFLGDPTGNRRWLPFEVESIMSPREVPFDYEGIYAQAYALYREGFQFWFSKAEILKLSEHNRHFETPRLETELVSLYFRKPVGVEGGMFMSVARAMQIISSNIAQKLSAVYLGRAFVDLGFQRVKSNGQRGYIVVQRTAAEIQETQRAMAAEAESG